MEYDKTTTTAPGASESHNYAHDTATSEEGRLRIDGPAVDTGPLAEPITLAFSGRTAKNRFLKAPMTERLCTWNNNPPGSPINSRGFPTPEYQSLYSAWGAGSIGIIVAGNIMIKYDSLEAYGNPILCDDHDNRVSAFRRVADAAKREGSLFIAQISHPGRQGPKHLNGEIVSASDVQLGIKWAGHEFGKPRPLEVGEIGELVRMWGETAFLCWKSGFDGVQVHCAHGYLLAQFLSPTTNHRTDDYGGPFANRSRIITEILTEIRRRVPDPEFILCVKLNSVEFQPNGQTPQDCRDFCLLLEQHRVDFVDLSGGTFEGRAFEHKKESTRKRESYFIEFAETIRPLLQKTKVFVTGGFRTAAGMVKAVGEGACDGVGIGRPLGAEPLLCKYLLEGRVQGALENFVPLPQNTQATGTQLHQVGRGERVLSDWSDKGEVGRWVEAFERETERRQRLLPEVDSSGYPPLQAVVGVDYYLK